MVQEVPAWLLMVGSTFPMLLNRPPHTHTGSVHHWVSLSPKGPTPSHPSPQTQVVAPFHFHPPTQSHTHAHTQVAAPLAEYIPLPALSAVLVVVAMNMGGCMQLYCCS